MGIEEAENIKEVTFEIFVEMVKQMRHNQRRYKHFQNVKSLETVEKWEKLVDKVVNNLDNRQIKLFI
jgi:hypothetical protein